MLKFIINFRNEQNVTIQDKLHIFYKNKDYEYLRCRTQQLERMFSFNPLIELTNNRESI